MKVLYFTGTGNSLYVAKGIGGDIYSIPQMIKEGKYEFEDEAIGFVYPCYGFGMAKIITDFIKKSKFKGSVAKNRKVSKQALIGPFLSPISSDRGNALSWRRGSRLGK